MKIAMFVVACLIAVGTASRVAAKRHDAFQLKELREARQHRKDDKAERLQEERDDEEEALQRARDHPHHRGGDDVGDDVDEDDTDPDSDTE
jgi:hypothetical protein